MGAGTTVAEGTNVEVNWCSLLFRFVLSTSSLVGVVSGKVSIIFDDCGWAEVKTTESLTFAKACVPLRFSHS